MERISKGLINTALLFAANAALATAQVAGSSGASPLARVDNAKVFPFFASGGGWESTLSLVNIADAETVYRLRFFAPNGQPAVVSFRDKTNRITAADTIDSRLADDAGERLTLLDAGPLQTGWAQLEYDGDNRIAAVLVFRQRVPGRPDFEASVPLTRNDETRFWIPFDNTAGFTTTMALTNPSASESTNLQIRCWDFDGNEILSRTVSMGAGTILSFSLPERYPELSGRVGQLRIEGSGGRLSGIALRFNSGGAFSTVPIYSR